MEKQAIAINMNFIMDLYFFDKIIADKNKKATIKRKIDKLKFSESRIPIIKDTQIKHSGLL